MAIQTANIGTTPNDGTGETLRSFGDKFNDNFTDTTNAASRLVTTSSTDTTAGRVLTTGYDIESLGNAGSIVTQDYEAETWTPVISSTGTAPVVTYSLQNGSYVRVGDIVTASGRVDIDTVSTVGTGNLRLNLPFTSSNLNQYIGSINRIVSPATDLSSLGALSPATVTSQAYVYIYGQLNSSIPLSPAQIIQAGTSFTFTVAYRII